MNHIKKTGFINYIGTLYSKKIIIITTIVVFIVSFFVNVNAVDNAIDAANRLAKLGVIVDNSTNPSGYKLDEYITRREMLKVMMNLSSVEVLDECDGKFSDLPPTDWGCKYAESALKAGFIAANPKFRPNDTISEFEVLKMIMQARGVTKAEGINSWQQAYLQGSINLEILPKGTKLSESPTTRSFVYITADSAITATTKNTDSSEDVEDLGDLFKGLLDDAGTGSTTTGSTTSGGNIRVIGECGSANGQTLSSKPTSNLCSTGQASNISEEPQHRKWTCYGNPSGDAYCSTKKIVNGVCGVSNGQTVNSKPKNDLCIVGKASLVDGTGPWTWTCNGSNGGIDAQCSTYIISQKLDGVCGISHGQTMNYKPTNGLCNKGTESSISGIGPWTWTCFGSNGGVNANCKAEITRQLQGVHGECGSADKGVFTSPPSNGLCANGNPSDISGTGPWSWVCKGVQGGKDDSCEAFLKVNGICGTSNGQPFNSEPTSNLCSAGSPSTVSGNGPWSWVCSGINGGNNASCSAIMSHQLVNGVCGKSNGEFFAEIPSENLCSTGSASTVSLNGGTWNWSCKGLDGGTNTPCSAFLPKQKINGTCGSTNGHVFTSKPTSNLCTTGTPSSVTGTGPWSWNCSGIDGGSSASCVTLEKSQPIDAICGPAGSGSYSTAPIELCTMGIPSVITQTSTSWRWVCQGLNGGQPKICSASRLQVIDGKCGISHENSFERSPTQDFCLTGSIKNFSGNGPRYWECGGINGGSKDNCYALKKINGVCGNASGQSLKMIPVENLCASGNETKVNGSGPWNWECKGENGGLDVSCSAKKIIYGVCGSSNTQSFKDKPTINYCSGGTVSVINGTGPWNWECKGENGGSSQKCTALKKGFLESLATSVLEFFGGPKPIADSTPVDNVSLLEIIALIIIIMIILYGGLAILSYHGKINPGNHNGKVQKFFRFLRKFLPPWKFNESEIMSKLEDKIKEHLAEFAPHVPLQSDEEIKSKVKTLYEDEIKSNPQKNIDFDVVWGKIKEKLKEIEAERIKCKKEEREKEKERLVQENMNKIFSIQYNIQQSTITKQQQALQDVALIYESLTKLGYECPIELVYNFMHSLKSRNFVILHGEPGCGKTSFVERFTQALYGDNWNNYFKKIVVDISFDDVKSVVGCYDRLAKNISDPRGLVRFISQAYNDPKNPYFILFDEINKASIESYFSYITDLENIRITGSQDFKISFEMHLYEEQNELEKKIACYKSYSLASEFIKHGKPDPSYRVGLKIPANLYIIGTVNKEINRYPFAPSTLDRADVIHLTRKASSSPQEIERYKNDTIDFLNKTQVNLSHKDNTFISGLQQVWGFEGRTEKSLIEYLSSTSKDEKYAWGITQKLLPKVNGAEHKPRLEELLQFCENNEVTYHLQPVIERIKLFDKDHPVYWTSAETNNDKKN